MSLSPWPKVRRFAPTGPAGGEDAPGLGLEGCAEGSIADAILRLCHDRSGALLSAAGSGVTAPSPAVEDAELVRRVADRDADALATLYDRYSATLLGLARRVLRDTEEAEDVLQEVFVQVWRQASRYDGRRSSVSTWLVLITRSRAIDRLRTRQVKERTAEASRQENPASHTSPEGMGAVLSDERRRRLARVLGDLPEEQRQVIELAFYRGLTQTEIAEQVSIPLGTVKTRTLLAMKKLRAALQEEVDELL